MLGGLLEALETWNLKPVKGHLSPAGPEDRVFYSPQLPGPVSLAAYLDCCEQSLPESPPSSGQFLLQWDGKQASGGHSTLDGESRQAASLVNQSKIRAAALRKPPRGECEGVRWVGYPDRSLYLCWKSPDGLTDYHARLSPAQQFCSLTIAPAAERPVGVERDRRA